MRKTPASARHLLALQQNDAAMAAQVARSQTAAHEAYVLTHDHAHLTQ
jgi:hypothetical protein